MKTKLLAIVQAVQSVSPIGAAAIFVLAYVACLIGFSAAIVVVALLAGMHFAKRPVVADVAVQQVAADYLASPQTIVLPAAGSSLPMADTFAGLIVREVKLGQPTANGKAKAKIVGAV